MRHLSVIDVGSAFHGDQWPLTRVVVFLTKLPGYAMRDTRLVSVGLSAFYRQFWQRVRALPLVSAWPSRKVARDARNPLGLLSDR